MISIDWYKDADHRIELYFAGGVYYYHFEDGPRLTNSDNSAKDASPFQEWGQLNSMRSRVGFK